MDYIVNYNVSNVNIHCLIQEKDAIIARQQKEIEDLHKANQLLAKDNNKLKTDLDLQKKLNEALEKFKYSLERHVAVLKDYDKNKWSVSETESEVTVWEHEYLIWKKTLEKREKDEANALLANHTITQNNSNTDNSQINEQNRAQPQRRSAPKPKTIVVSSDGTVVKRYVCDYPNCTYSSNWAHDLKGHKRKHTGEKPYCCGWLNCNKSFRDLRDLKRHQRAHTGDKRYSCDWPGCDYRSTDVANLAKHKRTHTGEKPYKCTWSGCDASFADGSHLRRHQKKHENQFSKMTSKSTAPKKRATAHKSQALIKTRQQPGRRAKGSLRIALEAPKSDAIEDNAEDKPNESNKTIEVIDSNHQNNETVEESVTAMDLNSRNSDESAKNNSNSDQIPDATDNDLNLRLKESESFADNTSHIQQMNRNDMNQNSMEESNVNQMSSDQTQDQNANHMSCDNRLVIYNKNPIVITSLIDEQNNPSLNSSPLQENGTKYSDLQRI